MTLIDNELELLTETECRALLARARIGRVAITMGALPAVYPVNHRVVDGDILFLTGAGSKLRAALNRSVVAFQVDEFDPEGRSGWSVLAVGVAEEICHDTPIGTAGVVPFARGDREHLVRIRPEILTGRRINPSAAA